MKPIISLVFLFFSLSVFAEKDWKCVADIDGKIQELQPIGSGYELRIEKSKRMFEINFESDKIELDYHQISSKSKNQSSHLLICEVDGINCYGKFSSLYNGHSTQRKLINEVNSRATIVKDGNKEVFKFLKTSLNLEISYLQDTSFTNITYRCKK